MVNYVSWSMSKQAFCTNIDRGPYLAFIMIFMSPPIFLLLFGPIRLWVLLRKREPLVSFSGGDDWFYFVKMTTLILLLFTTITQCVLTLLVTTQQPTDLFVLAVSDILALVLAIILHHVEYTYNLVGSGVLLFYWISVISVDAFQWWITAAATEPTPIGSARNDYLFQTTWFLAFVIFILEIVNYRKMIVLSDQHLQHPAETANIFGRLMFSWIASLMNLQQVVLDDVWPVLVSSDDIHTRFQNNLKRHNRHTDKHSGSMRCLCRALISIAAGPFALSGLIQMVHGLLQFILPVLLWRLLGWMTNYTSVMLQQQQEQFPASSTPIQTGAFIAGGLFVTSVLRSVALQQYSHFCSTISMRVYGTLGTEIYKKLLKTRHCKSSAVEAIVLFKTDLEHVKAACGYIHIAWCTPLQVVITFLILHFVVGPSVWAGVSIVLLAVSINLYLGAWMRRIQIEKRSNKKPRLAILNEIIAGIQTIKLYTWENSFVQKVSLLRSRLELALLRKAGVVAATESSVSGSIPFLVSLATYSIHTTLMHRQLTMETIIVSLVLIEMLFYPCAAYPRVLSALAEATSSLRRIAQFLDDESSAPLHRNEQREEQPLAGVHFRRRSNNSTPEMPTVVEMNGVTHSAFRHPLHLQVRRGELVGVVGSSAITDIIMGDVAGGCLTVRGTVAYVSLQRPWVMRNRSLMENIVFGRQDQPFEPGFYRTILDLVQLPPDADPDCEKSKVALARALYCRADIYLLDDPPHNTIDRQLFQRIFMHILRHKTRILVTCSFSYLHQLDRILMVSAGHIIMDGSFGDLMSKHHAKLHQITAEQKTMDAMDGNRDSVAEAEQYVDHASKRKYRGNAEGACWRRYFSSCSFAGVLSVFAIQVAAQACWVGSKIWICTSAVEASTRAIGVYAAIGSTAMVLEFTRSALFRAVCAVRAADTLHHQMLEGIIRSPLSFFHIATRESIMYRFNKDQDTVDQIVPKMLCTALSLIIQIIAAVAIITYSTRFFGLILISLALFLTYYHRLYARLYRELKTLEACSKKDLHTHVSETASGVLFIRAYNQQEMFIAEHRAKMDDLQRVYFALVEANCWMAVRAEFAGALFVFGTAILAVIGIAYSPSTDPIWAGLSLLCALPIPGSLTRFLHACNELESHGESIELIQEWTDLPDEDVEGGISKSLQVQGPQWPAFGRIDFDIQASPAMLHHGGGVTIRPGEKISIVGKDKLAFAMQLFCLEGKRAHKGTIWIDHVNIMDVPVAHLRSKLTFIGPEQTVLFTGTVRENLDPLGRRSDLALWDALSLVRLSISGGLDASVQDQQFTPSQRRLFCVARGLVRRSRIVVIEETALMDIENDDEVQQAVRQELSRCTVITAAHRMETVMASDRVLVLDDTGSVAEFVTPQDFLNRRASLLFALTDSSLC